MTRIALFGALSCAVLAFPLPTLPQSPPQPNAAQVTGTYESNGIVYIFGAHLSTTPPPALPVVQVGGAILSVSSYTDSLIVAPLTASLNPGSYPLYVKVFTSKAGTWLPTRDLTIGAVGPQGIQGPPGPIGPLGPTGPTGPTGSQGPQGMAGIQGETGQMGPQGPVGATGPVGPQGSQGPVGPQGPSGVLDVSLSWADRSNLYLPDTTGFAWLTPPVTLTITSPTQKVFVVANKSIGATAALVVEYRMCYATPGTSVGIKESFPNIYTYPEGHNYVRFTGPGTAPISLQAIETNIPPGTYQFGLCGGCGNGQEDNVDAYWTTAGFTQAILMN